MFISYVSMLKSKEKLFRRKTTIWAKYSTKHFGIFTVILKKDTFCQQHSIVRTILS